MTGCTWIKTSALRYISLARATFFQSVARPLGQSRAPSGKKF